MKKLIALTLLLCTLVLLLSSCGSRNAVKIEKPEDTNLEYWLGDSPNKREWTQLTSSGRKTNRYLAQGYEAVINENGDLCKPEHCVVYVLEDELFSSAGLNRIADIIITDPSVQVWGFTINSSKQEVETIIESMGFKGRGVYSTSGKWIYENYMIKVEFGKSIIISCQTLNILHSIYWGEKVYD